jgi:tetratricopeptide (TPR) repeat protein
MLIKPSTCPICENMINDQEIRCPHCRCIVQFTLDLPTLSRADVVESLVQPTLDRCREQIVLNPHNGIARYILGLCYLNYALVEQGMAELQQAATLLPEKHIICFELAVLHYLQGQYVAGLEQVTQALNLAPGNRDYRYLQFYFKAVIAPVSQRQAVTNWIAAYEIAPELRPASEALSKFISTHEKKLTQPIARSLPNLEPREAGYLKVLNSDPAAEPLVLPPSPKAPAELGKLSMTPYASS